MKVSQTSLCMPVTLANLEVEAASQGKVSEIQSQQHNKNIRPWGVAQCKPWVKNIFL
jgi:hypothetical protein